MQGYEMDKIPTLEVKETIEENALEQVEEESKRVQYSLAAVNATTGGVTTSNSNHLANISSIIGEKVDSFTIDSLTVDDTIQQESKPINNFNIFQALDLFSKEGFLGKEDRKYLDGFERDLDLEAKLLDNSLSYDDLTPEEVLKMSDYFKLLSKLTPKLESANPKKISNLVKKYSEDNGKAKPFKKQRFRDVKKKSAKSELDAKLTKEYKKLFDGIE